MTYQMDWDCSWLQKVSSVLGRNAKQFGKQHMFDNSPETCWNSDQGKTQFVVLDFPTAVNVSSIEIMFQGGFVGKKCDVHGVEANGDSKTATKLAEFYPTDSNSLQSFALPESAQALALKQLQIIFPESTDFYGRIVIYKLDVLGKQA